MPEGASLKGRRVALAWSVEEVAELLDCPVDRVKALESAEGPGDDSDTSAAYAELVGLSDDAHVTNDPHLSEAQLKMAGRKLFRRLLAHKLAARHGFDPGTAESVLYNLELSPGERLAHGLRRGRLKRHVAR